MQSWKAGIGRYDGFKGRLGEDAAVLKEYLDHDVAMDLKFSRLLAYAIQKRDEDTSQSASQALLSRAQLLYPGPWRHPPLQSRSSLGYRNRS